MLAVAMGGAIAAVCATWAGFGAPASVSAADIGGTQPTYGPAAVSEVPNAGAVVRRMWLPGLDAGYNPQGMTVVEGAVLVASYRSNEYSADRGPCRVFRVDPRSGAELGHADVPAPCGHAGGLAITAADGQLYVADTHTLFAAPLDQLLATATPRFRRLSLGPGVIGALAASSRDALWIGTYRENEPGRLYRFDRQVIGVLHDGETLSAAHSSAQIVIPSYAQGATIDRNGRLWVSRSAGRWGELDQLSPATGAVERRYPIAPGVEGIAADADGLIWAVSEAGSRHTYDNLWAPYVVPFYPLVFALDPARLVE